MIFRPRIPARFTNTTLTKYGKACYNLGMSTMNISITDEQAKMVDVWTTTYGYANRSEFFRTVLRSLSQKPAVLKTVANELEFVEFKKRPLPEMRTMLESTGKYNQKFINSIMKGLSKSSVYARN